MESTYGMQAIGAPTLVSMAESITALVTAVSVMRVAAGTMACLSIIGPSTILATSRSPMCNAGAAASLAPVKSFHMRSRFLYRPYIEYVASLQQSMGFLI